MEVRKLKHIKANNPLFQATGCPILETIICKKNLVDRIDEQVSRLFHSETSQLQALRMNFESLHIVNLSLAIVLEPGR